MSNNEAPEPQFRSRDGHIFELFDPLGDGFLERYRRLTPTQARLRLNEQHTRLERVTAERDALKKQYADLYEAASYRDFDLMEHPAP